MYCGIMITWNGSIMESSIHANQIPFPLNSQRAKPYDTIAEEITAPIVEIPAITIEFLKKMPKLYPANPFQPVT